MNLRMSTAPHIRSGATTQSIMFHVLVALAPCAVAGIYYFGFSAALLMAISVATAVLCEFLWQKIARQPVRVYDLSAAVTGLILGLNLPATAPWWLAVVGSALAILLVKQLFGGIGDNFMNPAMTARAILLASWPVRMTAFVSPTFFGASALDAVTAPTPLATGSANIWNMFIGNIPGCIGEVSKVMILVGLVYLILVGVISWRIPVVMTATAVALCWAFGDDPLYALMSGGLLFGATFMATDYTTSPMTAWGQIVYAFGAGLMVALIRNFGNYPEGVTYGILLMNVATPLIDRFMKPKVYGHQKEAKGNA